MNRFEKYKIPDKISTTLNPIYKPCIDKKNHFKLIVLWNEMYKYDASISPKMYALCFKDYIKVKDNDLYKMIISKSNFWLQSYIFEYLIKK